MLNMKIKYKLDLRMQVNFLCIYGHIKHKNQYHPEYIVFIIVKENTKSIGYLGVIIGGIGITAFMFYMIFDELFSNKSPNSVYSKALDRCIKHPKVTDALGEPIKAYGEESRRGRRSHIR